MAIPAGFEKLPGRSKDNAKSALEQAVKNGFAAEDVRTVRDGYLIPVKTEAKAEAKSGDTEKKSTKRGASKKE